MNSRYRHPRAQAERLAALVSREGACFRAVVRGKRREGKTDLLEQVHAQLFARAEGPVPFLYTFGGAGVDSDADRRDQAAQARHCFASFCQQVRAFLMRQEELLGEPAALLERELERPGLPLSLTELAQNFLTMPPEQQMTFLAALPGQWAYLERRPVCWLLDDVHELDPRSPIFAALASPRLSWLLTGRSPFLRRYAGRAAWPIVALEPFTLEEALASAGRQCRTTELPFVPEAWESWFRVAGTSPWLIQSVIEAAAFHGSALDSLEELGRLYIGELSAGSVGNCLAERFERALPDRRDRATVARFLGEMARTGLATPTLTLPARVWDGLVSEEWAVETPLGPRLQLEPFQWDWLWLLTTSETASRQRAQARALQTFLSRAAETWGQQPLADLVTSIRRRLLALPERGFPTDIAWTDETDESPEICSVAHELSRTAELFWCYGFRGGRRDAAQSACVVLIALCREEPTQAEIEAWRREVENEERLLLPSNSPLGAAVGQPWRPRRELWLVLPRGASLRTTGSERRVSLETFARWLEAGAASAAGSVGPIP